MCINLWCTSSTLCSIEHFGEVHTTHNTPHKSHKTPIPPPNSLPGFAVTVPSRMRTTTSWGPASCATRLTQSAMRWLPCRLLLWRRRRHLCRRHSLRRNAGQPPHHPSGLVLDIVHIAAGNQGCRCEEHKVCCGEVVDKYFAVRLGMERILVPNSCT